MDIPSLDLIRNIGIVSHIDAGKTTVSERILFYTGETHKIGEVHEGEAVMDWMPQEQERGITITATATTCRWGRHWINLIDTPGHIDFTIEVERSMRVLDGAIAIFSAVEGVQPQSESVWRQAERYRVPRVCFINKLDRIGADPLKCVAEIERKLRARPVLLQLPVGSEAAFAGVIDLIDEELLLFSEQDQGRTVQRLPVPPERAEEIREARRLVIEAAADFDDAILTDYLEGNPIDGERLRGALARGTIQCRIFPVLLGSALRNKGVQPLLDAVAAYLPSPLQSPPLFGTAKEGSPEPIPCDPKAPLCALAFKVTSEEGKKLTYLRIYAGTLQAGTQAFNVTRRCHERINQLFRMHAHKRERIEAASAGDIVAALGLKEALTGDTLCAVNHPVVLEGLTVPEPVVSLAVEPRGVDDQEKLPPALEKLQWEDPTFRVREDAETGQTILTGMGELHLEIIADRLDREYGVRVKTGPPQVVYRESLKTEVERRERFHREIDGKVQEGEIGLRLVPLPRGSGARFVLPAAEGSPLPAPFRQVVEESLQDACVAGCRTGYPLTDLEVRAEDIPFLPGITTELGLRAAAHRGLCQAAASALLLLEPVMALEIIIPEEYAGKVLGTLQQKRGRVEGIDAREGEQVIAAQVPLAEMFGYMTELRSATKGRGTFTMEFARFDDAPAETQRRFGL
ncbi:MAG TPA: elongation factor G [Geobacteraceae bacterium]|nr:elongation factor G [Geobacteraceae bacterium]